MGAPGRFTPPFKRLGKGRSALACLAVLMALPAAASAGQGELIVQFDDRVGGKSQRDAVAGVGGRIVERLDDEGTLALVDFDRDRRTVEQALDGLGRVRFAEPDRRLRAADLPNDPQFVNQWALPAIGAPLAWAATPAGAEPQVVAVIDSGVDGSHPDLTAKMWANGGEIANGVDDDGNGYVDDVAGWDFYEDEPDFSPIDADDDHGTHVAGIVAAEQGNGIGISGVDPNARIMPLQFLGPDGGWTSDAVRAIYFAAANGADVINASWGGESYSRSLRDAIVAADMPLVAAAGNESTDNDLTPSYPASYDVANVVSVAATTVDGKLASYSNFGLTTVDHGAPGSSILSTVPGSGYASFSGTSMATSQVAGAISLLSSLAPDAGTDELINVLAGSVDPLAALGGKTVTGGQLNLSDSLVDLLGSGDPEPDPAADSEPPVTDPAPLVPDPAPVVDPGPSPIPDPPSTAVPEPIDDSAPVSESPDDVPATLSVAVKELVRVRRGRLRVPCKSSADALESCTVKVYARRAGRRVTIGRATAAAAGSTPSAKLRVAVRLNRAGRRLVARRAAGVRVVIRAMARPRIGAKLTTRARSRLVAARRA